ncbi:Oligomerization domain-containing protein [Dimargaris cristalligena]|uniref:Oligomerization domain-containing protein n=1 Tax=Dimargaris cristalligena TaxID=215637 RepID=A0A4P9ZY06_9FUNG|nr:Oligomerization domain-containing protein [Dimargaris cristalligena]|eukprot:RKP37802.1 Oligomerization domain-containing protein [Dimargaris cristalligena]
MCPAPAPPNGGIRCPRLESRRSALGRPSSHVQRFFATQSDLNLPPQDPVTPSEEALSEAPPAEVASETADYEAEFNGETANDSTPIDEWFVDPEFEAAASTSTTASGADPSSSTGLFSYPTATEAAVPRWQRASRSPLDQAKYDQAVADGLPWVQAHPLAYQWTSLATLPDWVQVCTDVLRHGRTQRITVLDMRRKCDWTEYMVIAESSSQRQIYAAVMDLQKTIKSLQKYQKTFRFRTAVDGADSEDWILLNLGRITVQVMTPAAREAYNLEGLWSAIQDPLLETPELLGDDGEATMPMDRIRDIMSREFKASARAKDTTYETITEQDTIDSVNLRS